MSYVGASVFFSGSEIFYHQKILRLETHLALWNHMNVENNPIKRRLLLFSTKNHIIQYFVEMVDGILQSPRELHVLMYEEP